MFQVVGFDPSKKNLQQSDYALASCASSVTTRCVAQPFDVLKIRFQLQVEPISKVNPNSKYRGLTQATIRIAKEEGVFALWKGHVPGQVLSIIYGTAQFATFEYLTKLSWKYTHPNGVDTLGDKNSNQADAHQGYMDESQRQILTHLVCGSLAGCTATFCSFPFDVVRTRLISQGRPRVYRGMLDAAVKMVRHEGVTSFYRGLVPSLIQIMPFSGLVFGFNRLFKQLWFKVHSQLQEMEILEKQLATTASEAKEAQLKLSGGSVAQSAVCGASAGFCSKAIVYPLDLLKKRLQVRGFGYARREFGAHHDYKGLRDGIQQILRSESVSGFYKGFYPSVMKSATSTAIQFVVYEQIIRWLIIHRD
jgi:solute carrier family 25 thiamine pyrophosphate transporter 19